MTVNTTVIDRKLNQLMRAAVDLQQPLTEVGGFMMEQIDQGFIEQRDPYNQAWKPLADSTLKARRRHGNFDDTILQDSGKMLESLDFKVEGNAVTMHMDTPADYHQEGGGRLPMRRVFPISFGQRYLPKAWTDGILAIFSTYIKKASK